MSADEIISLEEVLAGLPARRAKTLLFLIERRTAQIAMRSQVEFSLTDASANERDLAFFEAFALGQEPPLYPTIQQLERYASGWQLLVPDNPRLKAALVHALAQKYKFTYQVVPGVRTVLNLDESPVEQAYYHLYKKPLETIFASRLSLTEQLRWVWAKFALRLESIPSFWIASLVSVALGLPQAFLALPIAVAEVGPLATIVFMVVLGAINALTMACMAEAIGRSGDFRYGNAFVKQLATNYLGKAGSLIFSLAVGIRVFLIALACYIGLATTMANFTPVPAPVWAALLFVAGVYLLERKSLNFTVPVLVLLAALNISLLLILSLLAFPHVQTDNLFYVNLPFQHAFQPRMLQQVLGVSLMLYFGHVYVGECAKIILPRDPSAATLIWGSVAGTAFLTVLFCLWILAVNGAIAPQVLARESGTALGPLAKQVGPIVKVLGVVLVTLLLGMAWIRSSSLLINLAREWFPAQIRPILILPAKQGRLLLRPRSNPSSFPHIGLTYLGLKESQPWFSLDIQSGSNIHHAEIMVTERWEMKELLNQRPDLCHYRMQLRLEIHSADRDAVRLQVTSPMVLTYQGALGVTTDAGNASPIRKRVETRNFASLLTILASREADPFKIARRIWANLVEQPSFFLSISPLVLVFLLSEWLFFTGTQSFTSILSFAGVLGNSLVGGIFPVLLLVSSRQKGEFVPGVVFQFLNHPLFIAGIYGLFLGNLFLHGLVIWGDPVARISALGVALLLVLATIVMNFSGAFAPRMVIELRQDQQQRGRTVFSIIAGGQPQQAQVWLGYADGEQHYQAATGEVPLPSSLRYAIFQLPTNRLEELRVWAHRGNSNGDFESLPALLEVDSGNKKMKFDLKLSSGKILLPLIGDVCRLRMAFPESSPS